MVRCGRSPPSLRWRTLLVMAAITRSQGVVVEDSQQGALASLAGSKPGQVAFELAAGAQPLVAVTRRKQEPRDLPVGLLAGLRRQRHRGRRGERARDRPVQPLHPRRGWSLVPVPGRCRCGPHGVAEVRVLTRTGQERAARPARRQQGPHDPRALLFFVIRYSGCSAALRASCHQLRAASAPARTAAATRRRTAP
jgi:hypothetical protein